MNILQIFTIYLMEFLAFFIIKFITLQVLGNFAMEINSYLGSCSILRDIHWMKLKILVTTLQICLDQIYVSSNTNMIKTLCLWKKFWSQNQIPGTKLCTMTMWVTIRATLPVLDIMINFMIGKNLLNHHLIYKVL